MPSVWREDLGRLQFLMCDCLLKRHMLVLVTTIVVCVRYAIQTTDSARYCDSTRIHKQSAIAQQPVIAAPSHLRKLKASLQRRSTPPRQLMSQPFACAQGCVIDTLLSNSQGPSLILFRNSSTAQWPNRKMKVALGVGSVLFGGIGVSAFGLIYQRSKTKAGYG